MKNRIEELRQIISANTELLKYSNEIQDNWNIGQFSDFIQKILKDFQEYQDNEERPAFYTELQLLLNKYNKDNSYRRPLIE